MALKSTTMAYFTSNCRFREHLDAFKELWSLGILRGQDDCHSKIQQVFLWFVYVYVVFKRILPRTNKQLLLEFTFIPVWLACSYISLISDFKYETVQVKKANKVSDEVMEKEKEEDKSEWRVCFLLHSWKTKVCCRFQNCYASYSFSRCYTCQIAWYCSPECHARHAAVHSWSCISDNQDPSLIWPNGKVYNRIPPVQVRIIPLGWTCF